MDYIMVFVVVATSVLFRDAKSDGSLLDAGPQDKSVFMGSNIELVCDIVDSADFPIVWRFVTNDVWLTREDEIFPNIGVLHERVTLNVQSARNQYVLGITDIQTSDGGDYQCGYESDAETFVEVSTAHVVVVDPETTPECDVVMLPNLGNVDEVDVTCSWSSELSDAQAVILKNGQPMAPDVTLPDRVILRTSLGISDSFTCQLLAPVVSESKTCLLIPLTISGLKVRSDPLVATVELGSDVQFNCTAVADAPIESYVWSLNADAVIRFLSNPGRFRTDDNSRILTLFNIELIDDKLWVKCSADSQDGTRVTTMSVTHVLPSNGSSGTLSSTRRTPQELPRATTTPQIATSTETTNSSDIVTPQVEVPLSLPLTVIAVVAVGCVIVVLIILAVVILLVKVFRRNSAKDIDGSTVNTSWVMSSSEISVIDEEPEPKRFGRKSRSSSRKFLYSRRSSKKKNNNSAHKSAGVAAHLAPPQITPDPSGIYENLPRSSSSNSLHSFHSVQRKLRGEAPHNNYEVVKAEPPDIIGYKKPRPKPTIPHLSGDDGGYASIEDPEEVPYLVYADLDHVKMKLDKRTVSLDFDPSILYAKVKK